MQFEVNATHPKYTNMGNWTKTITPSLNIEERGLSGMEQPLEPVKIEPLPRVVLASSIIEARSPHHLLGDRVRKYSVGE